MDPSSKRFFVRMAVGLAMAGIFWWILSDLESCAGKPTPSTSERAADVEVGMSPEQVRDLLGAPAMVYEDVSAGVDQPVSETWEYFDEKTGNNLVSIQFSGGYVVAVRQFR